MASAAEVGAMGHPARRLNNDPLFITRALSSVRLDDNQSTGSLRTSDSGLPPRPMRLDLERLNSQMSQDFLCTPDFATPVEQQFVVEFGDPAGNMAIDETNSKSPAPSPIRIHKRPRHSGDADSDTTSQSSQNKSGTNEPSTCSKPTASGAVTSGTGRPPLPRSGGGRGMPVRRVKSPRCIRNPFLTGGGDVHDHNFDTRIPRADGFPFSRLHMEFKVGKELGCGNFSRVYRATHRIDGIEYAIKRTKRPVVEVSEKNQWLQEVQALAAVSSHPNIVRYYNAWAEPDMAGEHLYIQLELCGESLGALFNCKVSFKEPELVALLRQMAAALKHMHDHSVVHLDLKPDNIYRCAAADGVGPPTFKLGDFGLATLRHGKWRVQEGDARYLAPELLRSDLSQLDKADLFALGASVYELATGNPLPTGGERYQAIRRGNLMMIPHLSVQLQAMIRKLLHPDPKQRPSADAILKSSLVQTGAINYCCAVSPRDQAAASAGGGSNGGGGGGGGGSSSAFAAAAAAPLPLAHAPASREPLGPPALTSQHSFGLPPPVPSKSSRHHAAAALLERADSETQRDQRTSGGAAVMGALPLMASTASR